MEDTVLTAKLIKNKKGFTLIEVIIAIAVTTVILGTVSSMVIFAYKSYHHADERTSVLNSANSITEMVREYTFNAVEAEISTITAPPAPETDYTFIYCLNNEIYVDNSLLQSAKGIGIGTLELAFLADSDSQLLKYRLKMLDSAGQPALQEQNVEVFLNNCLGKIVCDAEGNCLKIKKAEIP